MNTEPLNPVRLKHKFTVMQVTGDLVLPPDVLLVQHDDPNKPRTLTVRAWQELPEAERSLYEILNPVAMLSAGDFEVLSVDLKLFEV